MRRESLRPVDAWGVTSMRTWPLARIRALPRTFLVCASTVLLGCVSVHVEPLAHESYPPRAPDVSVQWLESEPRAPHITLARITATSQSVDEDRLRENILTRARSLGADAVVAGKFDILESMGPSPRYESTLGPASESFSPYTGGWGWWSPFYYDPWSFVQSTVDQPEYTEYWSGTAIRYLDPT